MRRWYFGGAALLTVLCTSCAQNTEAGLFQQAGGPEVPQSITNVYHIYNGHYFYGDPMAIATTTQPATMASIGMYGDEFKGTAGSNHNINMASELKGTAGADSSPAFSANQRQDSTLTASPAVQVQFPVAVGMSPRITVEGVQAQDGTSSGGDDTADQSGDTDASSSTATRPAG